jgi:hypothetical protein
MYVGFVGKIRGFGFFPSSRQDYDFHRGIANGMTGRWDRLTGYFFPPGIGTICGLQ